MGPILFDPSDEAYLSFDWSDNLAAGVTLASVVHTVPSPLVKMAEQTESPTSVVKIRGAVHGGRYLVEGQATLSTGEVINRQWPILGWNA